MQLQWKRNTQGYRPDETLYLGEWKVGAAYFDGCTSKSDDNKYKATCSLPGIKAIIGHFATQELAKNAVERAAKHWIQYATC